MKKTIRNFGKMIIGIFILIVVFYKVGYEKIWASLLSVNIWVFPFSIVFFILFIFVGTIGAWILLRPISKIRYSEFIKCYIPSWAIGLFMPGKIGEASRIYFLKNKGISVGQGTAVFVMEKGISILVLGIIASFGFFIYFSFDIAIKLFGVLVAIEFIVVFMLISNFGRNLTKKVFLRKYQEIFTGFSKTIFGYLKEHRGLLVFSFIFNFLRWTFIAYISYLIYLIGFGINIEFYKILMISAIAILFGTIPISINGLGIRQGIGLYLYSQIGIATQIIASLQIIHLVIQYTLGVLGIIWLWGNEREDCRN